MGKLFERMAPSPSFCRLFAFGFLVDRSVIALAANTIILLINFSFSVFVYSHVMETMRQQMPGMWDLTTVMTFVKAHTYLLTPQITMVVWEFKKRALTDLVYGLDEIVSSVENASPKSFSMYATFWLVLSVVIEFALYGLFQFESNFEHFMVIDYTMIVIYNIWTIVPLLHYIFLMETIHQTVRDINDRITGIGAWKTYRSRWKELRDAATQLARTEFGVMIVAFVVCAIAQIVFFLFMLYIVVHKTYNLGSIHLVVHLIKVAFCSSWLFEVFRISHNCRLEMLRTKKILNSVKLHTNSDSKELRYASLYMLHVDFSITPCGIFEMSYRNLMKVATLISAFVTFQIQMKLR